MSLRLTGLHAPPLRLRCWLVALLGVVPVALFVQWSDLSVGGTMAAGPFPPLAASLLWAALLGLNRLWGRAQGGARPFTSGELLVILGAWLAANMAAGRGLLHPLLTSLAGPVYYARSGAVVSALGQHLPDWLAVTDPAAARAFFEGQGVPVPWGVWARPLVTWALFFVPFLTANVSLCALFERIWVRHERLAFPLAALPLEAVSEGGTGERGPAFRGAFLCGVSVPLLLHGFGAVHAYVPSVPCVPFFNDLSPLLTDAPWTSLKPLYLNLYPLLIGITFLAPADVTFGVWFFLLLNKAQLLGTAWFGWNDGTPATATTSAFPYLEEQSAGAYLMLAALLVWSARRHLRDILALPSTRVGRGVGGEGVFPTGEYRIERLAAGGFLFGCAGVMAWCVTTGMPLWFGAAFFGFYFAVALVLSRLMAESGVSWILAPVLPDKFILSLTGSAALAPVAITRLVLHVQHLRDTRQLLAPTVFQAGRLRAEAGTPPRAFYGLVLACVLLALVVGGALALPILYDRGALTLAPNSDGLQMTAQNIPTAGINSASARLLTPAKPSFGAGVAVLAGAGLTWALAQMRLRFLWWPLNPLGYALTGTLQQGYANKMVFSIFLGWALKTLVLRLGGTQGFRLLRGAALGLVCGDLLMGGLLKLLDALLGPSGYAIF